MAKYIRSARGEIVDFELLAIKTQLASAPVPKVVQLRKQAIDEKDGVRTEQPAADNGMLDVAKTAASVSSSVGRELKKK